MTIATAAVPALLTINDAADFLRVSPRTVYAITFPRGTLRCIRVGPRGVRYSMAVLQAWIDQQQAATVQTDGQT